MYHHISEANKEVPLAPGLLMAVACQEFNRWKRTQKIKRPEIKSREELKGFSSKDDRAPGKME